MAIEFGLCRSGRTWRPARAEVRRRPGGNESKMADAGRGGKTVPLGDQEPISRDAQRGMMVESAPVAAFKVPQPQLLFQLLVVAFDDPTVFGHFDQSFEWGFRRQCRQPVLGRSRFAARPFDQEPFLGVRFGFLVIAMCGADANGGKAGSQLALRTFTPK